MIDRLSVLVILVGAVSGCKPHAGGVDLSIEPTDGFVYVIPDVPGYENVHFGVRVAEGGARIDALSLRFFAKDNFLKSVRFVGTALESHFKDGLYRDFDIRLPVSSRADQLRIEATFDGLIVGRQAFDLVRYQQKNRYRLPLDGCWFVSSGHDFGVEHRRWYGRAHFAWDFVRVDATGKPYKTDGKTNEDYYAFGQSVFAPADGVVVQVKNDNPENAPGELGERDGANFVFILHEGNEGSKFGHLRRGSIKVKRGDRVERGQHIGDVGNSGMTDSPHLHFHFQRNALDEAGNIKEEKPLPILLNDYLVTSNTGVNRPTKSGRPRRGEFVCATQ